MISIKAAVVVGVLLITMASPALAFQCENLLWRVDTALGKAPGITAEQMDEIKALRDDGAAKHQAGNHGGSVVVLKEALSKLGNSSGSSYLGRD